MKQNYLTWLIFLSILSLAGILRFWNLSNMAQFDFDQEYAANFAWNVVYEFPLRFIGLELSIGGLFMGPWYYYFLTPFFIATGLHPIGGFAGSIVWSLIIITTYFFVLKNMFDVRIALFVTFLRSILFTKIGHDLSVNPPYASELLVIVTWWCFWKYWQGSTRVLPLLGLVFGLYTSIHPILFPFYLVFLILVVIKKKLPTLPELILSILAFLAALSPLLLFEYWRKFAQAKIIWGMLAGASQSQFDAGKIEKLVKILFVETGKIVSWPLATDGLFILLFLSSLGWLFYKAPLTSQPGYLFLWLHRTRLAESRRERNPSEAPPTGGAKGDKKPEFWQEEFHRLVLPITFIVFIVYYTFYPRHVPEYYLLALVSLLMVYIGASLVMLFDKKRMWQVVVAIVVVNIVVSNFSLLTQAWNLPSKRALAQKDAIVKEIANRQDSGEFFVSYIANIGWNSGFNYLFKYYGTVPQTREVKDPIYTIVLPKELSPDAIDVAAGDVGLILPDNEKARNKK